MQVYMCMNTCLYIEQLTPHKLVSDGSAGGGAGW